MRVLTRRRVTEDLRGHRTRARRVRFGPVASEFVVPAVEPIEFRPPVVLDETSTGWTAVSGAIVVNDAPFSDTMPTGNTTGTRVTIPASDTFVAVEKGGFDARLDDFMFVGLTINFPEDFNSGKTLAVEFRSDAAGTTRLRYTFPAPQIRSGPNELLVRVDGASTPGGGSWDDLGSGMVSTDVFTHIRVIGANSSPADAVFELDRVVAYTGKPATPCLILSFDGAGFQSHIDLALPKLTAAGFLASVNINPFTPAPINLQTLYDAGWDVIQQGRADDYAANPGNLQADYQDGRAALISAGFTRSRDMFSFTNSADVYANRAVLEGEGCVWSRSGGGDWNAITDYGSANNLSLGRFTLNNPVTLVQAQAWLDDVIANGATGVAQIHEIVASAPGALQIDQSIFDAFIDYAKTKVDSGELIVASPTQWRQAITNRRNGTLGALFGLANIPFGTTTREVFWANLDGDPPRPTDDNKYMTHLAQEVTALVTENCVHRRMEPNEGQFDPALFDRYYDFASARGIPLRYHVGLYHSGRPDWWTDETDAAGRAARYIREIMSLTAGKVYSVNVINECVKPADLGIGGYLRNDQMFGAGNDYRPLLADLFNYAKSLNPAVEIRYNDLCHPTNRAAEIAQRQGILDFLEDQVIVRGAQIDGFGAQGHLYGNDYDSPGWDLIAWQQFLRDVVAIGIPNIYISEFDVRDRLVGTDQERLDTIATQTREFIAATLEVLDVKGFDVWGSYSNRLDVVEDYPPGRPDMLEQKPMPYDNDLSRVPTIFQAWRQPILSAPSNRQPVAIAEPNLAAPQILVPPTISAPATTVGSVATRVRGEWLGYPVPAVTAGWMRDGAFIPGETGETYTFQAGDVGAAIDWGEGASNSQGDASANSNDITVTSASGSTPVFFGANTLAGFEGIALPVGATSISGGTATGYTEAGGFVAPTADGSADAGTIEFDNGDTWDVTVEPNAWGARTQAELEAVMALPAATRDGGKVVMRPGEYFTAGTPVFNDLVHATGWMFTCHSDVAENQHPLIWGQRDHLVYAQLGGCENVRFERLRVGSRYQRGVMSVSDYVFRIDSPATNLVFDQITAVGDLTDLGPGMHFRGMVGGDGDAGVLGDGFVVTNSKVSGFRRCFNAMSGKSRYENNEFFNIGGDGVLMSGSLLNGATENGITFRNNFLHSPFNDITEIFWATNIAPVTGWRRGADLTGAADNTQGLFYLRFKPSLEIDTPPTPEDRPVRQYILSMGTAGYVEFLQNGTIRAVMKDTAGADLVTLVSTRTFQRDLQVNLLLSFDTNGTSRMWTWREADRVSFEEDTALAVTPGALIDFTGGNYRVGMSPAEDAAENWQRYILNSPSLSIVDMWIGQAPDITQQAVRDLFFSTDKSGLPKDRSEAVTAYGEPILDMRGDVRQWRASTVNQGTGGQLTYVGFVDIPHFDLLQGLGSNTLNDILNVLVENNIGVTWRLDDPLNSDGTGQGFFFGDSYLTNQHFAAIFRNNLIGTNAGQGIEIASPGFCRVYNNTIFSLPEFDVGNPNTNSAKVILRPHASGDADNNVVRDIIVRSASIDPVPPANNNLIANILEAYHDVSSPDVRAYEEVFVGPVNLADLTSKAAIVSRLAVNPAALYTRQPETGFDGYHTGEIFTETYAAAPHPHWAMLDPFTVPAVTGAAADTPITSALITPTGIPAEGAIVRTPAGVTARIYDASDVAISDRQGGENGDLVMFAGEKVNFQVQSSATPSAEVTNTVHIGTQSATWSVTTAGVTIVHEEQFADAASIAGWTSINGATISWYDGLGGGDTPNNGSLAYAHNVDWSNIRSPDAGGGWIGDDTQPGGVTEVGVNYTLRIGTYRPPGGATVGLFVGTTAGSAEIVDDVRPGNHAVETVEAVVGDGGKWYFTANHRGAATATTSYITYVTLERA